MSKPVYYTLSGLGADHRIFARLEAAGVSLVHIPWKQPYPGESLRDYAARLLADLPAGKLSLMGLSFGGLVVQEMAAMRSVDNLVLLSTLTSAAERPAWMSWAGRLKLDRVMPLRSYDWMEPIQNRNLGVTSQEPELLQLVREYRRQVNQEYLNWAIGQVLRWKAPSALRVTGKIHRFHGQHDRLFPRALRQTEVNIEVFPDAGHLLVYTHAAWVARRIC